MVMNIIAVILMIPYIALKALEFVEWFTDDPVESFYKIAPLLAIMGIIIFFVSK